MKSAVAFGLVSISTLIACGPNPEPHSSANTVKSGANTVRSAPPPELHLAELIMDGQSRKALPFTVAIELNVGGVREPSDIELDDLDATGNRQVGKVRRNGAGYSANVALSTEGLHELTITAKGKKLRTRKIVVSKVPGMGGPLYRLGLPNTYAVIKSQRGQPIERNLFVPIWRSSDIEAPAYRAVWRGASSAEPIVERMSKDLLRSVLGGPMLGQGRLEPRGAWSLTHIMIPIPDEVFTKPGTWQLIVDVEQRPTRTVTLEMGADGVISGTGRKERDGMYFDLASAESVADPDVQKELANVPEEKSTTASSDAPQYPVSAEELRALTRSPELFALRKEMSKLRSSEHHDSAPALPRKQGETLTQWEQRQAAKDKAWKAANASRNQQVYQKQKALWPKMQKLIATFGGPWTEEETPHF